MQTHDCASAYINYEFASKDLRMDFITVASSQAVVKAYYIEGCFSKSASGVVLVPKRISSLVVLPVIIYPFLLSFGLSGGVADRSFTSLSPCLSLLSTVGV